MNEYDEVYETLIPHYQEAVASNDAVARERLAGEIVEQAKLLLRSVLARPREDGGLGVRGDDLMDAVTDASVAVLAMAREWDPQREVSFSQWLKSAKAPWRLAAKNTIDEYRNGGERTQGEARLLAVMFGILKEFKDEHLRKPTVEEMREQVMLKVSEGSTSEERNKRSGFDAALRHLDDLYASLEGVWYPDRAGAEGEDLWDAVVDHDADPVASQVVECDRSRDYAQLAGIALDCLAEDDMKIRDKARQAGMARLSSPHGQFAFLYATAQVAAA